MMLDVLREKVKDPAAWYGPELDSNKDWVYPLTSDETKELHVAVNNSKALPVREIRKKDFPLQKLSVTLNKIREIVDHGIGLALIKGLPVDIMSEEDASRALWGMGQYIGIPQPQDGDEEVLHHVRDTGSNVEQNPNLRYYQTNAEKTFHNDGGDLVMLLCRRQAKVGGVSQMVSAITIFNEIVSKGQRLAEVLQKPFSFDARGQQLEGSPPIQRVPIYVWYEGRLNALYKRPYIELAQRFDDVPRLSKDQLDALDLIDNLCADPKINLSLSLDPGDIQVVSNFSILHARSAFQDSLVCSEKRHMIRLWLGLSRGRLLPRSYRFTREFGPLFNIPGRVKS